MRPPRAVLFDMDETLYPERRFALSGFAAVARATATDDAEIDRTFRILSGGFRRGTRASAFQQLCDARGWSEGRLAELIAIYRAHTPSLRLPRAAERTLAVLRPDWRLAIVTNGAAAIQAAKVRALGLAERVDAVVYASLCGNGEGKPALAPFVDAAAALDVAPADCVFVGDDPQRDVAGARRAGMKTIRIRRGVHASTPVDPADEADAVIEALDEVPRLAEQLLGGMAKRCA